MAGPHPELVEGCAGHPQTPSATEIMDRRDKPGDDDHAEMTGPQAIHKPSRAPHMDAMVSLEFQTAAHTQMHRKCTPIRTKFCGAALVFSAENLVFFASEPRFKGGRGV